MQRWKAWKIFRLQEWIKCLNEYNFSIHYKNTSDKELSNQEENKAQQAQTNSSEEENEAQQAQQAQPSSNEPHADNQIENFPSQPNHEAIIMSQGPM